MTTPHRIDLNSLTVFDSVAESGSFTAAAERLGVAKAKVSVQVGRLERQLGVALFARTTRQVALTDAGRALHAQCQPLLHGLQDALTEVGSAQGDLTGSLRVSAAVNHATMSVAPALARFALLHPELRLDLRTDDRIVDLVAEGIDLSFRMGWLRDSSQRAIKLGEFEQYVVASPAYLARHGTPKAPPELVGHDWIALSLLRTPNTWKFEGRAPHTVHVRPRMQVDSPGSLLALLEHGAGVSVLEQRSAQAALDAGRLVRLLAPWSLPTGGIYAVLPPGRHVPAKVRAFIDFYKDYLERK